MTLTNEQARLWVKWIAALRSGTYNQGKYALRLEDESFCALGVACDLVIGTHPEIQWDYSEEFGYAIVGRDGIRRAEVMPFAVQNLFGSLLTDSLVARLALMNDDGALRIGGIDFDKIADVIEKCLASAHVEG